MWSNFLVNALSILFLGQEETKKTSGVTYFLLLQRANQRSEMNICNDIKKLLWNFLQFWKNKLDRITK